MSLKIGVGYIICVGFIILVEPKLLPATEAEIDNSIDSGDTNNDKGAINFSMPGTKWFVSRHGSFFLTPKA